MYLLDDCILSLIESFSRKPQKKDLMEDIRLFMNQFLKLESIYVEANFIEAHWDRNIHYQWIFRDLIDYSLNIFSVVRGKLDFQKRGYPKNVIPVWSFYKTDLFVLKKMSVILFSSFTIQERNECINYIKYKSKKSYLHPDARDL